MNLLTQILGRLNFFRQKQPKREPEKPIQVLIAEDDAPTTQIWLHILRGDDYYVETASTLSQALMLMQTKSFEILILDLRLGGGEQDADSLIDEWVRRPGSHPLCIVSGWVDEVVANQLYERGAFNVFSKPFSSGALRSLICQYELYVRTQRKTIELQEAIIWARETQKKSARWNLALLIGLLLSVMWIEGPFKPGIEQLSLRLLEWWLAQ